MIFAVEFTTEGVVVIGTLLTALAGVIGVLFKLYVKTRDQQLAEKDSQIAVWKEMADEAIGVSEVAANRERNRKGLPPARRKADVEPEASSPPTEKQKETADAATKRARLVEARLNLGITARKAGNGEIKIEADEEPEPVAAPAVSVAEIAATVDQVITAANPAACLMFGYEKPEDLVGKPVWTVIPERFRAAHLAATKRLTESDAATYAEKVLKGFGLRQDGSEFPLQATVKARRTGDRWVYYASFIEEPATMAKIQQDVSQLKKDVEDVPNKTVDEIESRKDQP